MVQAVFDDIAAVIQAILDDITPVIQAIFDYLAAIVVGPDRIGQCDPHDGHQANTQFRLVHVDTPCWINVAFTDYNAGGRDRLTDTGGSTQKISNTLFFM